MQKKKLSHLGDKLQKILQNKNETPVSKAHERKLNLKKKEVDTMSNYEFEQMEKELQEILQESMEMNLTQEQEEEQNKKIKQYERAVEIHSMDYEIEQEAEEIEWKNYYILQMHKNNYYQDDDYYNSYNNYY